MIISSTIELKIGQLVNNGHLSIVIKGKRDLFHMKKHPFRVIRKATREEYADACKINYDIDVTDHPDWNNPNFSYYEIIND